MSGLIIVMRYVAKFSKFAPSSFNRTQVKSQHNQQQMKTIFPYYILLFILQFSLRCSVSVFFFSKYFSR